MELHSSAADSLILDLIKSLFLQHHSLILAGNDSEGLRYGTIGTEDKYFLTYRATKPALDLSFKGLPPLPSDPF